MRNWLKKLYLQTYLPAITSLDQKTEDRKEAERWALWMKEQWQQHGLTTLKQQRNLMTEVRKALKSDVGEEHIALESMNFTQDEWIQINISISDTVAARNEQQCLLQNPDAIVERATDLFDSREWSYVVAGLAVTTGRRCGELLKTAQFVWESPYSVWFTGALKRRQEERDLRFEIPTLAPAKKIVAALNKIRDWVDTSALNPTEVNQKYSAAVIKACDRSFSDLIPKRSGRSSLYTHLFRSIYARIATYWYAPPFVADIEYMAAIQGHYLILDEHNPDLRRSLASTRHYFDYKIGDGHGNIDGRQGIRLGQPGVVVINAFKTTLNGGNDSLQGVDLQEGFSVHHNKIPSPDVMSSNNDSSHERRIASLRLFRDEHKRWLSLLNRFEPGGNQAEKMSALLNWIEHHLDEPLIQSEPSITSTTVHQRIAQFIQELIPLKTPQSIQAVCQREFQTPALQNFEDTYLPQYISALETNIQSGVLPLIRDQTAQYSTYIKQGVCYEKRTHYAVLCFENPNSIVIPSHVQVETESSSKPQSAQGASASLDLNVQKLDALTDALTQLTTVMRSQCSKSEDTLMMVDEKPIAPGTNSSDTVQPNFAVARSRLQKKNGKRGRKTSDKAEAKIHKAIDAIMRYNDEPSRAHHQKWGIGISSLKTLTKSYQGVIQRVVEMRRVELDKHHQTHGISVYHNLKHGHAGRTIDMFISIND